MLHRIIFCMLYVILATGYSQVGRVLFSGARSVPKMLNYQGYLTDTLGSPIEDSLDMTFKIFDAATMGNELWSESQLNVTVERGVFSVTLGSGTPIPDTVFTTGTDRWLELTLEGPQTLSPRTRITAMGYAYTSTYSDTAEYAKNAATDNDWVRGTPDSVLFTANYLGVSRGSANNMLHGNSVHSHTNLGVACTTGASGENRSYCTVGGGRQNTSSYDYATVGGGYLNTASVGRYATVGGGAVNTASSYGATIGGGDYNTASDTCATVAGGHSNSASGRYATVAGGRENAASGYRATVGGGSADTASGDYATVGGGYYNTASGTNATVGGGDDNTASGYRATVGGGDYNTADTICATVGGGRGNDATGSYATVAGGYFNNATGSYATVAGGYFNNASGYRATVGGGSVDTASGDYATVGGGYYNTASGTNATVGGGYDNTASGTNATVGGGNYNSASGTNATVGGGHDNSASGTNATVGGGRGNNASVGYATVGGGRENLVEGSYSAILGGFADTILATANYSYLFGINSNLTQDSTFMVDMPHIRFGDEVDGYEFPVSDGASNQVMATDGSGQLSWTDMSADNDWVRGTPDSVLFTANNLGIARGGANNVLHGDSVYTHNNLGIACTTGTSGLNSRYCTVGGGINNSASGTNATVGGGRNNTADTICATVGGGRGNNATGSHATVAGGYFNNASGFYATVGGGVYNAASGYRATVGGGSTDTASGDYATVGGGDVNTASGGYATVGGGRDNNASGYRATVGGGADNTASGDYATVGGGRENLVEGSYSAILGGFADTILATANYSYLFGINSNLTQDSTFMVDMPHIRFGDEVDGYEFPTSDGTNGQVMSTDGSGQLSWTDVPAATDWAISGSDMYSDVSGNVGVGTTSPQRALHISDVLRLEPRASAPSSPSEGDIYVNSTDHHIYCYLDNAWKQLDN